jgi:hypothetical protein
VRGERQSLLRDRGSPAAGRFSAGLTQRKKYERADRGRSYAITEPFSGRQSPSGAP